ncbi:MAG: Flp family type IVb pilin [Pseudomonadota bacterium]
MLKRFFNSTGGSTAIEYAIIAGIVSAAIVVGVSDVGSSAGKIYNKVDEQVSTPG